MKLTAGVAYRVTSSRYAASEPASASLASSASLAATDTDYTAWPLEAFQLPTSNSQSPTPRHPDVATTCCLGVGRWALGIDQGFRISLVAGSTRQPAFSVGSSGP